MPHHPEFALKIRRVSLDRRQPVLDIDDLATALDIDLTVMGDKTMFRRRLERALHLACWQGSGGGPIKNLPHILS